MNHFKIRKFVIDITVSCKVCLVVPMLHLVVYCDCVI